MKTVLEIKSVIEQKNQSLDDLLVRIDAATGDDVDTLRGEYDELETEIETLGRDLDFAKKTEDRRKRKADIAAAASRKGDEKAQISQRYSIGRAIRMSWGKENFDGLEKEMHDEAVKDNRQQEAEGVVMPAFLMSIEKDPTREAIGNKRDHTVGTNTEGGNLVATELGEFIPVLRPMPIIKNLGATIFGGLTANLDMARGASRASAAWEGEIDANAETNATFDKIQLTPKRVGAFMVESKQLITQSSINIDQYLQNELSTSIEEALDSAAFTGSGTAPVPEGVANTSGVGSVTTAGTMTEALAYGFKDDLAAAFALKGSPAFVTTPAIDSILRQIQMEAGSGLRLLGGVGGQNNNIMVGYPVLQSDILAAGHIIFGNWSELILAQWGGLDLVVNPYSLDTTNQVRITANSFWDVNVKHAASFSVATDM